MLDLGNGYPLSPCESVLVSWKRMRSGDRPGLQNRRAAGHSVTDGFDSHSLPPYRAMFLRLATLSRS